MISTAILLTKIVNNINNTRYHAITTRTIRGNLARLPTYRSTLRNRGITCNVLIRLQLRRVNNGSSLTTTTQRRLVRFCQSAKLPRALSSLNLNRTPLTSLRQTTRFTYHRNSSVRRLPFAISPSTILTTVISPLYPRLQRQSHAPSSSATSLRM